MKLDDKAPKEKMDPMALRDHRALLDPLGCQVHLESKEKWEMLAQEVQLGQQEAQER